MKNIFKQKLNSQKEAKLLRFAYANRRSLASLGALLFAVILLFGFSTPVKAATQFIAIVDPDSGAGTSYSSLYAWEENVQSDLTSATTSVFSFDSTTASGTIQDDTAVTGQDSGATATLVHQASSTDANQILLSYISGTFQSGEQIYITSTGASSTYVFITDAGDSAIAVAKCRSTGGTADVTAVEINGWTTASTTYIKIWTDPDDVYGRHNGVWDEGKYRLEVDANVQGSILLIQEYYTVIDGLQGERTDNIFSQRVIFSIDARYARISNCIAMKIDNTATTYGYSLNGNADYAKIYNSIAYNCTYGFFINYAGGDYYNNTAVNCTTGFNINGSDNYYLKNCLANNNTIDFNGSGNVFLNNCISSDGTADDFTGANNKASTTVQFLDATNNDYHLHPDDTSARNAGISLFNDATSSFSTDIDGTSRGSAWDIGADEVPVEFVSTICQDTTTGGACATDMDYSSLFDWEAAVDSDITASTTRVFSGSITGTINAGNTVTFIVGAT